MQKYKTDIIIFFTLTIIGTVICFIQGQDANWDLANYHYYSIWALFHNRIGYDIMPSGIQSYYNPTYDIPLYFLVKYFNNHPYILEFFQSLWYGISFFFVYKISALIFTGKNRIFFIICSLFIGMSGALSVGGVGLSYNDILTASFILCALYIYLKNYYLQENNKSKKALFFSAFLIGISTGLKFSGMISFIPFILLHIIAVLKESESTKTKIYFIILPVIAYLIGYSITGLPWYIYIWIKFGNPYFPLMNNIFKSPYAFEQNYADLRYLPKNLSQYLFYPFYWAIHPEINYVTEMENRDFRWAIAYISIFLVFIKFLFSKIKKENTIQYKEINPKIFLYIIFFITVSYIIWLNTSGILRYLNLIETLLGISAIGSIPYLFTKISNNKIYKTICVVIICFLVLSTQYMHPYYTRIRIPFSNKFLDFPNLNLPDNAIVFIGGGFPSAVFIPFQNPKAKWICLYSDIGGYNFDYPQNEAEKIKNLINDKNNKKYLIYAEDFGMPIGWEYIDIFLNTDDFECKKISQIWDVGYKLCQEK